MFEINPKTVSRIFKTWVKFMSYQFQELDIWVPKDIIEDFMPEGFKEDLPGTVTILDGTEIPIIKPANVLDRRSTWSSYKNWNTLKCVLGITPKGAFNFIPTVYGGACSDRMIFERCSLLKDSKLTKGDSVLYDKGFVIQDLLAPMDVQVNLPSFSKGKAQLPSNVVLHDRRVSSKRVHVEREIGLSKTFKILKTKLDHWMVQIGDKILFVCVILTNFKPCIITDDA